MNNTYDIGDIVIIDNPDMITNSPKAKDRVRNQIINRVGMIRSEPSRDGASHSYDVLIGKVTYQLWDHEFSKTI
jgi:hypothetical protein